MTVSHNPTVAGSSSPAPQESPADRATRLQREAAVIARAHADIEAGLGIEYDELEAWLDQLDRDENAQPPAGVGQAVRR